MAKMTVEGMGLTLDDLEDRMSIPDDVSRNILTAGAEVLERAQRKKAEALGIVDPNNKGKHMKDAIGHTSMRLNKNKQKVMYVYSQGSRKRGKTTTRNAEIQYINEYGAPRRGIPARQHVRVANEEASDEAQRAMEDVYDEYLKTLE